MITQAERSKGPPRTNRNSSKRALKKVIYIVSEKRSGSTVADAFISSRFEAVSAGEIINFKHYWQQSGEAPGRARGWVCRCGEKVRECSFWNSVMFEYLKDDRRSRSTDFDLRKSKTVRSYLLAPLKVRRPLSVKQSEKTADLKAFYEAIAKVAGADVIVDSSKCLSQLVTLLRDPELRALSSVLVVTRDARAVCHSVLNRAEEAGRKKGCARVFSRWTIAYSMILLTLSGNKSGESVRLKYEDICDHPSYCSEKLTDCIPILKDGSSDENGSKVLHNIGGTPRKLGSCSQFEKDSRWEEKRSRSNRFFYFIAAPLNKLLGYDVE